MVKDNRNNGQIYGRNDMIMLDQNNKIYGSLGLADRYVMKTEEGTRLMLSNPKLGRFGDVLTEFNIYGMSSQNKTIGKNLLKYPYVEADKTSVGITFKDNKDGSISISGTAIGTAYYNLYSNIDGKRLTLASGTYKLIVKGRSKCNISVNNGVVSVKNEGTFTVTDGHNDVWCYIEVLKDLVVDETIYPMIQFASITAESYEPYTGGKPSPSPDYPQEIKSVVNPTVKVTNEDGLKVQSVALNNITLNAIPVSSGGNVTINGQQWVCDEIDLKRGVKVQRTKTMVFSDSSGFVISNTDNGIRFQYAVKNLKVTDMGTPDANAFCSALLLGRQDSTWSTPGVFTIINDSLYVRFKNITSLGELQQYLQQMPMSLIAIFVTPIETPLTDDEIAAFNAFTTYYPVTIIENNYNTWMKATYKSTESV